MVALHSTTQHMAAGRFRLIAGGASARTRLKSSAALRFDRGAPAAATLGLGFARRRGKSCTTRVLQGPHRRRELGRRHERLRGRTDLRLLTLPEAERKDTARRAEALNSCDIAILCLPDAAARENGECHVHAPPLSRRSLSQYSIRFLSSRSNPRSTGA